LGWRWPNDSLARSCAATPCRFIAVWTLARANPRKRSSHAAGTIFSTLSIRASHSMRPPGPRRPARPLNGIHRRGHTPIIVGGTGLYFRALRTGLFDAPRRIPAIRARHQAEAATLGVSVLHRRLQGIDPEAAARIRPGDLVRTSRALEVYEQTGIPVSELRRARGRSAASLVRLGHHPRLPARQAASAHPQPSRSHDGGWFSCRGRNSAQGRVLAVPVPWLPWGTSSSASILTAFSPCPRPWPRPSSRPRPMPGDSGPGFDARKPNLRATAPPDPDVLARDFL